MTKRDKLERGLHCLGADVVLGTRSRARLFDGLACEDAERDRDRERRGELGQGSGDGVREDVEVGGLTTDQAAKRNDRVEPSGPREHRDGRRELEGACDLEFLDLRAFGERGQSGTLGQSTGDLVVPPCANDRDPSAAIGILSPSRSLPSGRHLSQSSPRMPYCPVSA
jgi:hypothetical protein